MASITHFFLGANSGQGFQNLFQQFCAPEKHYDLVVLKGGPGSGKSSLMRRVGKALEERGEQVEYLYCSGDPDSLDGVHIPAIKTAIVDGTAPHIIEPKYPAAIDRYVNLGRFYHITAAKEDREDIVYHTRACSAAYQRAYRALGAARQVEMGASALAAEGFDREKLLRRTEGIISRELRGRGAGEESAYRFLGSLTCKGPVWRFDTVRELCPRVYQIQDSYGLAAPMLEQIRVTAAAKGFRAIACPDPEQMERLQHLLLPELGLAFVTSREGMVYNGPTYRRVRVDAMISDAHYKKSRARLRFSRRMVQELREEGVAALGEAKAAHDALEAVYHPYVDFEGVEQVAKEELQRILGYLEE